MRAKYAQNALKMWGELLLCSSFFRNLTKSRYCVSYFFLLLITLYFISSYAATVAGGCPTLVLLKKGKQYKERMSLEGDHALPQLLTHARQIFFKHMRQSGTRLLFVPLETPLFALQVFGNLASTTARVVRDFAGFEHWHFT